MFTWPNKRKTRLLGLNEDLIYVLEISNDAIFSKIHNTKEKKIHFFNFFQIFFFFFTWLTWFWARKRGDV